MIEILECTLRDASYPISYQFTAEDTSLLTYGLYKAGFSRIEIGHGLGLGASGKKYGFAAATDIEYASAAASVLPKGVFGFFAIPGIASLKSIDIVAKYNGGFIRVGTDVGDTLMAESYIKHAKDLGLEVSSNLMKTYSSSVSEVVERSLQLQEWGADIISVVDSAGGMMGDSVAEYISGMVNAGVNKVGFHGHNNLQLAVSNAIIAINNGAKIVDSTLRGMGRSSGNAQTEALVLCLEKMGHKTGIDIISMLDISEKLIAPLSQGRGSNNIEVVSGFSLFHSGYQELTERIAKKYNLDIRKLIIEISDGNGEVISENYIENIAQKLVNESSIISNSNTYSIDEFEKQINVNTSNPNTIIDVADELSSWSKKSGSKSIFTISKGKSEIYENPFIRTSNGIVISNIEIKSNELLNEIISNIYDKVNYIFIDEQLCNNLSELSVNYIQKLSIFSESNSLILALDAFLKRIDKCNSILNYGIFGINSISLQFLQILAKHNKSIFIESDNNNNDDNLITSMNNILSQIPDFSKSNLEKISNKRDLDIIITFEMSEKKLIEIIKNNLDNLKFVIDASRYSLSKKTLETLKQKNIEVYRLDMRAALISEVLLRLETINLVENVCGIDIIDKVRVVAGGQIGTEGDIIVDSIKSPRRVIGIADGLGGVFSEPNNQLHLDDLHKVKNHILNSILNS